MSCGSVFCIIGCSFCWEDDAIGSFCLLVGGECIGALALPFALVPLRPSCRCLLHRSTSWSTSTSFLLASSSLSVLCYGQLLDGDSGRFCRFPLRFGILVRGEGHNANNSPVFCPDHYAHIGKPGRHATTILQQRHSLFTTSVTADYYKHANY